MSAKFTGRHMFAILVAFFGVVIAVNFTMARYASATFGGLVVENSYVASERYNDWLARAEEQNRLGWSATPSRLPGGRVALALEGVPSGAVATGDARHPLGRLPDRQLTFDPVPGGGFVSREVLPAGRWIVRIELAAEGHEWSGEAHVQ